MKPPSFPSEMSFHYWWPKWLCFSTTTGNRAGNVVDLERLMHYLSKNQGSGFYSTDNYSFCFVDVQDKLEFRTISCLCFFWPRLSL